MIGSTLPRVWCGVLGPLVVRGPGDEPLTISGPARRLLFAALVSRVGRTVPPEVLVEDLWGHVPPRTAAKTLQSHVVRLRDDLGRDPALVTDRTGYRLELPAGAVDARSFEDGVRDAAERAAAGDSAAALARLDAALDLWRGDAYEEFADAPFSVAERLRLFELKAHTEERRTDLALDLGRAGELISTLEKRVAASPYRERGWEQLILALYRAGRQAEALGAYRRAARTLAEDLGVDPGPALRELEERVLRQDSDLLAPARPATVTISAERRGSCPYLGLATYSDTQSDLFVGRERLTAELAGLLADHRSVVVVGASGTGKSSMLRAGLVAALRGGALPGSASWRTSVVAPADVAGLSLGEFDLVVVDQGEELFSRLTAAERADVAERLEQFSASGGRLVLALRGDFYGRLAELQPLAAHARRASVLVGPLREDELRRVVLEPAQRVGLEVEDALVETVLNDVAGQPAALPMLSAALVRTWENRSDETLTLAGYQRGGGVATAVEATAEDAYRKLDEGQRGLARRLLVRLAGREGDAWVRRPVRRDDLAPDDDSAAVLSALAAARLVTVTAARVEITHDALLAHWPRLRGWLEERVLAAELLDHLDVAARAWQDAGRPASDLYRGARLQSALDWRDDHPDDVSELESAFLDASAAAAETELAVAREQLRREARARRRLRAVVAGLAVMVLLAGVGVAIALHERSSANRAAQRARAAALTADARRLAALSLTAPDIASSSLLAVAAYRLQDTGDTRGALLSAVERNQSALWRFTTPHRALRVAATPDGTRLAVLDNRRQVHIIDPRTRRQVTEFPAHADTLDGITPDGRQVIVYGPDRGENPVGRLSVVDVATGRRLRVLTTLGVVDPEIEPVMSTDDHWVALLTTQPMHGGVAVDVFDTSDWTAAPLRFAVPADPVAVAAGRDSVAVEHADGSMEIRRLPSLRLIGRIAHTLSAQPNSPLALAPDASRVAVVDARDPRTAAIFPVRGGQHPATPVPSQPADITQLAFSPDGAELALTSLSGSVGVYHSADASQAEELAGHAGPVVGLAWSGTGAPTGLYTAGLDSQLVSWSVSPAPRLVTERGPTIPTPDRGETFGHFVLGVTPEQGSVPETQIKLFRADLDTGRWAAWPVGLRNGEYVNQAVSSRDGTRGLLTVQDLAGHNRVEIWDLARRARIGQLSFPADTPAKFYLGFAAAISPDGRTAYCSLGATRVGVFALPSGRYLRSFQVRFAPPDGTRVIAVPWRFDPLGRLLVAGFDTGPHATRDSYNFGPNDSRPADQRIAVVDVQTGRTLAQAGVGDVIAISVSEWSPDGRLLAIGTVDGTLTLYDASTLAVVADAGAVEPGYMYSAMFSPDGRTLITSGTSGSISFLAVPSLDRIAAPLALVPAVNSGSVFAWYAPDGDVVGFAPGIAHSANGLLRWFDLKAQPAELARTACALAGGSMTVAQWRHYLPDQPYQKVC